MPTTLPQAERRHRASIVRSARIGGHLAKLVRASLADALAGLPDDIGPHHMVSATRHVHAVVKGLADVAGLRLFRLLVKAAEREHLLTAVALTRAANEQRRNEGFARLLLGGDGDNGLRYVRGRSDVRAVPGSVISEGWRDYFRLLVPPPALDLLERIVGAAHDLLTRLIDPQRASRVVLQGVAEGKDRKQIAKDLEGVFDGYANAARRVARTEGLRVATATQLHVSEQIPELVIGYELNTVLDDRVRPEHRKLHGAKFYRNPTGRQRPLSECPQPPIWDGKLAHNCRCHLIPIISIDGEEV